MSPLFSGSKNELGKKQVTIHPVKIPLLLMISKLALSYSEGPSVGFYPELIYFSSHLRNLLP
jgi:hypothetical protein